MGRAGVRQGPGAAWAGRARAPRPRCRGDAQEGAGKLKIFKALTQPKHKDLVAMVPQDAWKSRKNPNATVSDVLRNNQRSAVLPYDRK